MSQCPIVSAHRVFIQSAQIYIRLRPGPAIGRGTSRGRCQVAGPAWDRPSWARVTYVAGRLPFSNAWTESDGYELSNNTVYRSTRQLVARGTYEAFAASTLRPFIGDIYSFH
jgi:hypothetical protein